jgi:hypothetical protein
MYRVYMRCIERVEDQGPTSWKQHAIIGDSRAFSPLRTNGVALCPMPEF